MIFLKNKLSSLIKETDGVIPFEFYSNNFANEVDRTSYSNAIGEFQAKNPNILRIVDIPNRFKLKTLNELSWYLNLKDNTKKWKMKAEL